MKPIILAMSYLLSIGCGVAVAHPDHNDPEAGVTRPGHTPQGVLGEWAFWPDYGLPGRDYIPPVRPSLSAPLAPKVSERLTPQRLWFGQQASDRRRDLMAHDKLPTGPFTVEFWVSYHVNQPVGAAAFAFDGDRNEDALWQFGFWQGDTVFSVGDVAATIPAMELKSSIVAQDLENQDYRRGVTRYWHHLVGVYDGQSILLYHQGELRGRADAKGALKSYPDSTEFEITAYLEREPHMTLGNLVKRAALYDRALTQSDVQIRFDVLRELV